MGPPAPIFRKSTLEEATFRAATLRGANFRQSTFEKGADFSGAAFLGTAEFAGSKFAKPARFSRAKFDKTVFDWARFDAAKFDRSSFKKAASFYECDFTGTANFRNAVFRGKSYFSGSEFGAAADFSDATFAMPMHFRAIKAKCPALVRFDGNVSNVSFLDTDVKETTFGSRTTWSPGAAVGGGRLGRLRRAAGGGAGCPTWNKKWCAYDERLLDEGSRDKALNLENVKNVYRDMRDNSDRSLAYGVSGGFFVREMEVERKYGYDEKGRIQKKHIVQRAVTWHAAYNVLSEYGQSLMRPMLCLSAIFGAGLLLLWCPTGISSALEISCRGGLGDSALRTLASMVPIPLSTSHTAAELGLKIASLPASATFLIALRRRFEKSRRH